MSIKRSTLLFTLIFVCIPVAKAFELQSNLVSSNLPAPEFDAKAWVLMEMNSGTVVTGHNADQPMPPASITKLMMNYVVFQRLRDGDISLSSQVPISEDAWRAEGSRMFADVNTRIELAHLLKSTIIQSGNDAAIALAEYAGGTEYAFAQLMNQAAAELGLQQSHFENSSGLPAEGHAMSAHDIARLAAAIIREFPEFYSWYSEKEYTHNNITQKNRNRLLWKDDSVDGLKTGHTEAAGYCLVASAQRGSQRWIAVVLGSESERTREKQVLALLNYGFAAYDAVRVSVSDEGAVSAKVYGGLADSLEMRAASNIDLVVPKNRQKEVTVALQYSPYFEAPIIADQSVGLASVQLGGTTLAEVPLVAATQVDEAGWWKQLVDSIKLSIHQMMAD
ncbi:D-alanyl-D-alanine carboxypeptidase family protein [Arenicella xantha]|uniref:serine-type D-Ala-D-Ala carboxypeptidase n=1 Tax=Arenicella xantha TaxID=644221 RepID=A0A395JMR2_9GAMM|nr:D-alanyl-D-alanine carboxypeptidase family protein [Arenicella xantha]RBP50918.1 D-alanyl-D-alanine carboxypeptidase (penicillin-binding protein 5/6) [Arenicella xantha]